MWKKILEIAARLVTLGRELEQNRNDVKELRRDLLNLALLVQRLSDEIRLSGQREAAEREKLVLQLDNELLKFERKLPPAHGSGKGKRH
jgi:predicted  nucleic acid-binding Zn-ribbon protein